jgi:hypothetical protein
MFGHHLRQFDGTDVWALILSSLPSDGTSAYLQTAGSAEAMTVEICKPTSQGAQSVRYVVGHPHAGPPRLDVEVVLPRSTEVIARHEVSTPTRPRTVRVLLPHRRHPGGLLAAAGAEHHLAITGADHEHRLPGLGSRPTG